MEVLKIVNSRRKILSPLSNLSNKRRKKGKKSKEESFDNRKRIIKGDESAGDAWNDATPMRGSKFQVSRIIFVLRIKKYTLRVPPPCNLRVEIR